MWTIVMVCLCVYYVQDVLLSSKYTIALNNDYIEKPKKLPAFVPKEENEINIKINNNDNNNKEEKMPQMKRTNDERERTKTAFIVPDHFNLMVVSSTLNKAAFLPEEFQIIIYTRSNTHKQISNVRQFDSLLRSNRMKIIPLNNEMDRKPYNELMTTIDFWKLIPTERVLVYKMETFMCSGSDYIISDFEKWDYIGAPWKWAPTDLKYIGGGNGAFSLRLKSQMIKILEIGDSWSSNRINEDMYFVKNINKFNITTLPPPEISKTFSVEEIASNKPLAVYHLMRTVDKRERLNVLVSCPEARALYSDCSETVKKPSEM